MTISRHKPLFLGTLGLLALVASCSDSTGTDPLTNQDTVSIEIDQIGNTDGVPVGKESDVVIGALQQTSKPANDTDGEFGGSANSELERESVLIQPYKGPPIYLNEPPVPPPATIVTERKPHETKYEDGTVHVKREISRYSDNRIENDGNYHEYFPNGQLFVEGEYVKGKQHGEWVYWHDNGQHCRTVNYQNGLPDGSWDVSRDDGTLDSKRSFKAGKRDGEWIAYDNTGKQKLSIYNYRDGQPHGVWNEWFLSGQQKRAMQFKDGKREGKLIEWDDTGNKRAEAHYKDGQFHGVVIQWSADGEKFVQKFEQGRPVKKQDE